MTKAVADALRETLISPNVIDTNFEAANVVDVLHQIARGLYAVAKAIENSKQAPADFLPPRRD